MVTLVLIRDILIAVLLSWIGVDVTEPKEPGDAPVPASQTQSMSVKDQDPRLLLGAEELPDTATRWFHT